MHRYMSLQHNKQLIIFIIDNTDVRKNESFHRHFLNKLIIKILWSAKTIKILKEQLNLN